eukprot:GDKK01043002.1.p1 GENE.GDKK01043002.1~~GDKK01043002.1.p1  ORF type:complete len:105 (-),score=14.28 GDKK01043002.1:308-622(-)
MLVRSINFVLTIEANFVEKGRQQFQQLDVFNKRFHCILEISTIQKVDPIFFRLIEEMPIECSNVKVSLLKSFCIVDLSSAIALVLEKSDTLSRKIDVALQYVPL